MTLKQKQALLAYLGYYDGPLDGVWGQQSRQATEAFQRDFQLTVDGVFGSATEKRILEVIATGDSVAGKTGTFWDHIRYWSREEFACRCGEYHAPYCSGYPVEPDQTLVELLDDIRAHFGRPAIRSSGIRCMRHNADSKGVSNSRHLYGKAMDFFIPGVSGEAVRAFAAADPRCNYTYVIEGNCVHVDVT